MPVSSQDSKQLDALWKQSGAEVRGDGALVIPITTQSESTKAANATLKEGTPEAPSIPSIGGDAVDEKPGVVKAVTGQFAEGAAGSIGLLGDMAEASAKGELPPITALRMFLPKRWIEGIPLVSRDTGDNTGELVKRFVGSDIQYDPNSDEAPKVVPKGQEPSGKLNEFLAPAIRGMGSAAVFPGSPARTLIAGAGAGELGDLVGKAGRSIDRFTSKKLNSLFNTKFDESGQLGEEVGGLAGGTLGGQLNVARAKAMGKVISVPAKGMANLGKAAKTTLDMKRAGDARDMSSIFMDNYSTLRAESKSMLQQHVINQFASFLRNDPRWQKDYEQYIKALDELGLKVTDMNPDLGQMTGNKTIADTIAERRPDDIVQKEHDITRRSNQQEALHTVYKRLTGEQPEKGGGSAHDAYRAYQNELNQLNTIFDTTIAGWKRNVVELGPEGQNRVGEALKAFRDELHTPVKAYAKGLYDVAEQLDAQIGHEYSFKGVSKEVRAMLQDTLTHVDPTKVPQVIRNAAQLLMQHDKTQTAKAAPTASPFDLSGLPDAASNQKAPVRLADINKMIVELGDAITSESGPTGDKGRARNLYAIQKELLKVIDEQAPEPVRNAYTSAREFYATRNVPMFKTAENYNLDRRGGVTRLNEDAMSSAKVVDAYLTPGGKDSVRAMNNFNNLFGGLKWGETPVKGAYEQLAKGLEDRFHREVLNGLDTNAVSPEQVAKFEAKAQQFYKDYSPVVKSIDTVMPGWSDKLLQVTDGIAESMVGKRLNNERFADIADGPLGRELSNVQTSKLFGVALSDPRKMGTLIREVGPQNTPALLREAMARANPFVEIPEQAGRFQLDPDKLLKVLQSGYNPEAGNTISAMQVLMRQAEGKELGDKHFNQLRDIANVAKRNQLTTPLNERPQQNLNFDPAAGTGTSTASIAGVVKSVAENRVGPVFAGTWLGSRFFNAKMQGLLAEAMQKALYDPATASAIRELAMTPDNKPLSSTAVNQLFGNAGAEGKSLIQSLSDHGYIRNNLVRGEVVGNVEQERKKKDGR